MPPPALMDELVEEILLRLPPDETACLVRASLVCKPWRRILADPDFRRRYREFQRRPHLLGLLQLMSADCSRFVPTSAFRPAKPIRLGWLVLDCRHGRALLAASNMDMEGASDFVVWDPMTDDQHRVPQPEHYLDYTAAVLCAAEGCDHRGCQGGAFRVAFVSSRWMNGVTSARLYSSETGAWSDLASLHHIGVRVENWPSVLVGDALYFRSKWTYTVEYQLGTPRLSVLEPPPSVYNGRLITAEDGGLGFASVDGTSLTLWSRGIATEGAEAWVQRRVIDLKTLLPDDALSTPQLGRKPSGFPIASVTGFTEGTDVIFMGTYVGVYMVELKSGRVRKVSDYGGKVLPYMSFYIPFPAMEAASTDQGQ